MPTPQTRLPDTNARAAQVFDDIADLLEVQGGNPFRVRAYKTAARELRMLSRDVGKMLAEGEDLSRMRGIGKDLAGKIEEIVQTGHCATLDELHEALPESLHEVLRLPGIGPKKVRVLFDRLGVRTLADLAAAANAHRVRELPGFGPKSEQKILDAIAGAMGLGRRMNLARARPHAARLVELLRGARGVDDVVVAGSFRRGRATVGDLDILVTASPSSDVMDRLAGDSQVARVVAKGKAKTTVLLKPGLQVDVRVLEPKSFGAALYYFTGSKAHNIAVRTLALKRGLKINEYGVFRGDRRIAGRTESSVFEAVDLPFIPPELRENRGEIEAAKNGNLPQLLEDDALCGDLVRWPAHAHGPSAFAVSTAAAEDRGLEYLVIVHEVDTTERRWQALRERVREVQELSRGLDLEIRQGVEIVADGKTMLPAKARGLVDLVIATLRCGQHSSSPGRAALGAVRTLRPDGVRLVLHDLGDADEPTGDVGRLVRDAMQLASFLVVEGTPAQLATVEPLLRWARAEAVPVVVASGELDQTSQGLQLAVVQARRAWVEPLMVLNARSWDAGLGLDVSERPAKRRRSAS